MTPREASRNAEVSAVHDSLSNLKPEAVARFMSCKASHRFMAFLRKELVVYTIQQGRPAIQQVLTCVDVGLSNDEGIYSKWFTGTDYIKVGHTPCEIAHGVFLWHTFLSDVRYQKHNDMYCSRFSMLYKSQHHPRFQYPGVVYISERITYNAEFPNGSL